MVVFHTASALFHWPMHPALPIAIAIIVTSIEVKPNF